MAQASKTRQRAQERRAQRRRQTQVRIMIGVGVGALILAGLLILLSRPPSTEVADTGDYAGLEQSVDSSLGGPGFALGDSSAPVTLVVYSDFSCPHCRDLAPIIRQLIDPYVRDGQLRIVFKPVSFVNPPTSEPASQAMMCAGEQGRAWEMHDQIWALSEASGPGSYTGSLLSARAEALGLDRARFNQCFDSAETRAAVEAVNGEATGRGVTYTPVLFVNGQNVPNILPDQMYEQLVSAIEAALGS